MPRLVDAEKLLTKYLELCEGLACINCPFFGLDNRCGLWLVLQEQTVDAIPIEWIKEWVNNYCDRNQEKLIEILLRTWNKKECQS